MSDLLLEVRDLHVSFYLTEGIVRAVSGVNLNLRPGKTLGVVGESGCGKSVTARAILNMVQRPGRIDQGEILWYGDRKIRLTSPNSMRGGLKYAISAGAKSP